MLNIKLKSTWVKKHDNYPKHTSGSTSKKKEMFARSPDRHPLEMTCDRKWIIYAWKPSSGAELPQFCNEEEDKIPPYQLKTHFKLLQILDADIITKDATTRFRGKVLDTIACSL